MKKLVAVAVFLFAFSAAFAADNQVYFGINSGYAKTKIDINPMDSVEDSGFIYGMSGGIENEQFRVELSVQLRQQLSDTIDFMLPVKTEMDYYAFMLNGYYKFYQTGPFSLYAGAGIGAARTQSSVEFFILKQSYTDTHTVLALYLGATYNLTEALKLDVGLDYYYWKFQDNTINNFSPRIALRLFSF